MSTQKRSVWCYVISDLATGQVLVQYVHAPRSKECKA